MWILILAACGFSACGSKQHTEGTAHQKSEFLRPGADAPALSGVDQRDQPVVLRTGTPTLVYFYPRDGTPGCTKEACAFRDAWQKYTAAGLRVIGVSADSAQRHRKFAAEHGLPYSLIADPEHVWSDAFGVGTFAGFDARRSFLIDAHDRVVKSYEDVDPGVHADQVLGDARQLGLVSAAPAGVGAGPSPAQP
jgi:peroxiredoxin Q/BCP